jgi:hypothetical protein
METEKALCWTAMVIAGLVALIFLIDAALGIPFRRASVAMDIMLVIGAAFVLWQGIDTYRELR